MKKTTRLKKPQIPELESLYFFDDLGGRPKYGGVEMTSATDIPSFQEIMDETHSAVVAEATARDDADEELQAQINTQGGQISDEAATRQAADTLLSQGIADEATARQTEDAALAQSITTETSARQNADSALQTAINANATAISNEETARQTADNGLQTQIDAIVASSDVKDIVGTYAELQQYDTSTLGDQDIIKVLADETHDGAMYYYRWDADTTSFSGIGAEGPYYTKGETDSLLNAKADKSTTYTKTEVDTALGAKQDTLTPGANITIDANNEISAAANFATGEAVSSLKIYSTADGNNTDGLVTRAGVRVTTNSVSSIGPYSSESDYDWWSLGKGRQHIPISQGGRNISYTGRSLIGFPDTGVMAGEKITADAVHWAVKGVPFMGATSLADGVQGMVPKPLAGDEDKFLKGDGTWGTVAAGPTVVQTTGTSTTDVMSQNATTKMVFDAGGSVVIGKRNASSGSGRDDNVVIGRDAKTTAYVGVAIGAGSTAGNYGTAIGQISTASGFGVAIGSGANNNNNNNTVALGANSVNGRASEVSIGAGGSSSGSTRYLANVTDPQLAQDAATKNYVDTAIASAGATVLTNTQFNNLWENA